jgi:hypothetical protein
LGAPALTYDPSAFYVEKFAPFQADFIAGDVPIAAIIGGKGSSKTFSGARYVIAEMDRQPRSRGLLMWNTLKQAEDIFVQDIEPLLKAMGLKYNYNKSKHDLSVNGCLIHLRSAEPNSIENIESVTYDWGWADEVSFYDRRALTTFDSRIRTGLSRRRYTSMPDEPDAFMYTFLENMGAKMYEIGLRDNPSKRFRERYEAQLRAIYSGSELDRYLFGRRVSLTGAGAFAVDNAHRVPLTYDPKTEIVLSWDFNNEYRAVSAWQHVGSTDDAKPVWGCVRSWQMKEATVYEDASRLCNELKGHTGDVVLIGDASGANRTALTTASMWTAVREVFSAHFPSTMRYRVPSTNPPVKDTIQCMNWALRNNLVLFDPTERNVFLSLSAAKLDKYGDIDKAGDGKASGAKSHETDTARYLGWHVFGKVYPGNLNRYWVV